LQKGTKAGLNLIRRSTGKLKEIIKKSPLSPLLNRSEGEIEEGIAKLSNGAADRETLGAAITDGLDDELAAVNKYQKGLYDKAYSGIEKTAPMSTANTEAMLDELKDEVTPTGQKYLEKIRKNLRIEKRVKDTTTEKMRSQLKGSTGDPLGWNTANLTTTRPASPENITELNNIVNNKIHYKIANQSVDNFDDVVNYLKNITPTSIEKLKHLTPDELKTLAQKLADDEIKKGTIKGIRDAGKMIVENRGNYVHTLPTTLSKTDVATEQLVKGELKEYLIKKYGNEVGNTVYDTVIKKNGILDTKFVNDKGNDSFIRWLKHSIEKDSMIPINEGSVARFPTGNTANLTTPSVLRGSVPSTTDIVNTKVLNPLNANKRIMEYPNIRQLQSLKSEIGGDVMRGTNTLNSSQVGRIYDAIKKDIDKGVGSLGAGALKKADRFYRLQQKDGSITKTLEGLLGAKSDTIRASKVMNALNEKTANFKVIKALNRALNAEQIKDEGRALIRTQRDFNKLSRDGKRFLYGDKLKEAENLFNGALGDRLFKAIDGALKKSAESNLLTKNISDKTRQKIITAAIIGSLAK